MILHDWSEVDCLRILSQLAAAMKPDTRIIVMDMVLPRPGSLPLDREAMLRQKDLVMKQNFNAKERDLEEWEIMMKKVGLSVAGVKAPLGSQHSVLTVVKEVV